MEVYARSPWDEGRLVTAVPQGAGPAIGRVDVLHLTPAEGDDQSGDGRHPLGGEQQVHMMGHENLVMQPAALLAQGLPLCDPGP